MIKDEFGNRRYFGLYRGVVQSIADPQSLGRIQVVVPQVLDAQVTGWIWVQIGVGIGSKTPAIGQGVWIQFEGGDPSFPVCVGFFGSTTNVDVIDCGVIT